MKLHSKATLLLLLPILLAVGGCWMVTNPVYVALEPMPAPEADPARLEKDVRFLAGIVPPRSHAERASLDRAADYIAKSFKAAGCPARMQTFRLHHVDYRNVICSFGPTDAPRLVLGAHYDVYLGPGADDNASGVAGLLELARLLARAQPALEHRLDLVAFTLEESPHFRSENMGSYVYADRLVAEKAELKLMISIEMIGFFSSETGSQSYPFGLLGWLYPDRANYIGVVGKLFARSPVARVKTLMRVSDDLPVESINAPALLTGVDFSDHWSFWQHGLPAVMVTDTGFLRNPNYHEPTDTPDTLDYDRMALVVDGLYQVAVKY